MVKLKSTLVWALVWLNVVLMIGWAIRLTSPSAQAQFRQKANLLMIPGAVQTGNGSAIYIVNTDAGSLAAIFYNEGTGRMEPMHPIDLNGAFQHMAAGGR